MTPRDCVRLLVVGICTGLLPACLSGNRLADKPASNSAEDLSSQTPGSQSQRPVWSQSPYASNNVSPYGSNTVSSYASNSTSPYASNTVSSVSVRKPPANQNGTRPDQPQQFTFTIPPVPAVSADTLLNVPPPTLPPPLPSEPDMPPVAVPAVTMTASDVPALHKIDAAVTPTAATTEADVPNITIRPENAFQPPVLPGAMIGEPPLVAALRSFIDKRPGAAIELMKQYDPENQEILLHLLPLTVRMTEGPLSQADPQEIAAVLEQLQGLMASLQPRAALVVDKLCFCRQVRHFGMYESLSEKPEFHVGELVEVYCELRNISCERIQSPKGEYRTHLQSRIELRGRNGFHIDRITEKADVSHTPQHDYYLHYQFAIKNDMRPGPHSATIEVVDVPTGRKISRKLEFVVLSE